MYKDLIKRLEKEGIKDKKLNECIKFHKVEVNKLIEEMRQKEFFSGSQMYEYSDYLSNYLFPNNDSIDLLEVVYSIKDILF